MALVMTEPEVPAAGPLVATMPVRIHGRLPAMMTRKACQSSMPSRMSVAPTVKLRTLTFGAAHTGKRSRARPWRSDDSMSSMPRFSGWARGSE
ncbi:hypothetical protein D3C73_1103090 [compost metagenome]